MSEPKRRKHTEEFKAEAVRLVRESGKPVTEIARNLGIAASLLYRWSGEERSAERLGTTSSALKAEREELAQLRRELDTGKKGAGFFKTCGGVLREGTQMRYRAIRDNAGRFDIRLMCRAAEGLLGGLLRPLR